MKKALIIVDIQNDFCPGGSLAVKEGDSIIPLVNEIQKDYDLVITTQDFHPKNHSSFKSNSPQGIWVDHCVQGTSGADFHKDLDLSKVAKNFPKGQNPDVDSYSGFFDNDHKSSTGLSEYLKENEIKEVHVVGLALDYCVKATAIDAVKEGFITSVIADATKAVNINPDDGQKAISELLKNKVNVFSYKDRKTVYGNYAVLIAKHSDLVKALKGLMKLKITIGVEKETIYFNTLDTHNLDSIKKFNLQIQDKDFTNVRVYWSESQANPLITKALLDMGFKFQFLGDDGSWIANPYYLMVSEESKEEIKQLAKEGFFNDLRSSLWKFE